MTDSQSLSQSITEPNTPEPCGITDEALPSGDFARLTPVSTAAKLAFHNLAEIIDQNLGTYRWHRRYLHVRDGLEELSEDGGESTGTESATDLAETKTVRTGFWRFNLEIRPAEKRLGWILGKGRWQKHAVGLHGGVDILLTNNGHEQFLYGRHARIVHNLQSNSLVIIAERKIRFDGENLRAGDRRAFKKRKTSFSLGPFEYQLEFTGLDENVFRDQLAQLAKDVHYDGQRPASFTNPTPTDTDYALKEYTIRSSFARGSSCYVCSAIDKTGGEVAVKKIIANSNRARLNVENEVKTLRRITCDGVPPSISRFIEYIAIEPSSSSGVTECYLIFQPLIYTTLSNLLPRPDLSVRSRVHLVEQTLSGLAFIHSKGCMHRDIKPENVLASAPPSPLRAVIIDFGAATFEPMSDDHMKGTIRYLAPEIMALKQGTARSGTLYDKSADVWAAGLTAYEVICGWRFRGQYVTRSVWEEMQKLEHWQLPFVGVEQATKALEVANKMLEWEAKDRVTSLEAWEHDVFQEFHSAGETEIAKQLGDKRPGLSVENERRPSTRSKTKAFDD